MHYLKHFSELNFVKIGFDETIVLDPNPGCIRSIPVSEQDLRVSPALKSLSPVRFDISVLNFFRSVYDFVKKLTLNSHVENHIAPNAVSDKGIKDISK